MALAPEHRLHRDQVVDRLWPDAAPRAATNDLHRTLHAARRVLEPALAAGTPPSYLHLRDEILALCPRGPLWVDVDAFTVARDTARRSQDPADYEAALGLYHGDLLPEDCYDDWAAERRDGLRRVYLALLVELAELYEARGEAPQAMAALERALASEPTNETAHARLMRLYALAGQRDRALRQFDQFADILRHHVEAEPGAAMRRLREDVLAERLSASVPGPRAISTPVEVAKPGPERLLTNLPRQLPSFVGRQQEIAELRHLLATKRAVTLTGPGGGGKSRLALEVAGQVTAGQPDGGWLMDLGPVSERSRVSRVPLAVAAALGVHEVTGRPVLSALVAHLRTRRLLLVLETAGTWSTGAAWPSASRAWPGSPPPRARRPRRHNSSAQQTRYAKSLARR